MESFGEFPIPNDRLWIVLMNIVLCGSGGTAVMKDADGYRSISRDWIQGWGQGLALAFFAGVLNYDNVRSDGAL